MKEKTDDIIVSINETETMTATLRLITGGKEPKVEYKITVLGSLDKKEKIPAMIAQCLNDIYDECKLRGITLI